MTRSKDSDYTDFRTGVDIEDSWIVVGDGRVGPGSIYLFELDTGGPHNWGEEDKATADPNTYDGLGTSVSISGGRGQVPASVKPTLDKILQAKSNLDLLRKVKGNTALKARLARSLATLEGKLGELTARYVQLDEQRARLQGEMWADLPETPRRPGSSPPLNSHLCFFNYTRATFIYMLLPDIGGSASSYQ